MFSAFSLLSVWMPLKFAAFAYALFIFFVIRILLRLISLILDAIPFV